MSVSYLLRYYLHAVISFASITSTDITIVAPLYPSFLFFLSMNVNIFTLCQQWRNYTNRILHMILEHRATVMSLFFTTFVANKHNRFHNCPPGIVSMKTNREIYLTVLAKVKEIQ